MGVALIPRRCLGNVWGLLCLSQGLGVLLVFRDGVEGYARDARGLAIYSRVLPIKDWPTYCMILNVPLDSHIGGKPVHNYTKNLLYSPIDI